LIDATALQIGGAGSWGNHGAVSLEELGMPRAVLAAGGGGKSITKGEDMQKGWIGALVLAAVTTLSGCAVQMQQPLALAPEALASSAGKVGVVMTPLPKVDTEFPGAGCLLCIGVARAAHSSMTDHVRTLSQEDLAQLPQMAAALVNKKGAQAVVLSEPLKLDAFPKFDASKPNFARQDFRALREKHGVDKLIVIQVDAVGVWRGYSSYVPTEPPKGTFNGAVFMVNLRDNALEWFKPINVRKGAENWDQPPKFPGLTNAYFQALEQGKDEILQPLQ
jgi:hypothetical protein